MTYKAKEGKDNNTKVEESILEKSAFFVELILSFVSFFESFFFGSPAHSTLFRITRSSLRFGMKMT